MDELHCVRECSTSWQYGVGTWCETNVVKGPTSAKNPIYRGIVFIIRNSIEVIVRTHFVDIVYNTVNDFSLERFEHDRAVTRYELGLPASTQHHALPDIDDMHNCNDVPKLT